VITAQRIATTWRPRRSRLEKTTSEGTFLVPAPSFGAAHDAGQPGTCAQLTIAHICATTSAKSSSRAVPPALEANGDRDGAPAGHDPRRLSAVAELARRLIPAPSPHVLVVERGVCERASPPVMEGRRNGQGRRLRRGRPGVRAAVRPRSHRWRVPTLEEITYEAGRSALADQESLVSGIRQRTGTLLAANAIVASFLGATTIRDQGLQALSWVAVTSLVLALVVAAVLVALPRLASGERRQHHPHVPAFSRARGSDGPPDAGLARRPSGKLSLWRRSPSHLIRSSRSRPRSASRRVGARHPRRSRRGTRAATVSSARGPPAPSPECAQVAHTSFVNRGFRSPKRKAPNPRNPFASGAYHSLS
jgi:hypothetical protein